MFSFSFSILKGLGGGSTGYSIVMTRSGVIGCGGIIGLEGVISLGGVTCLGSCSILYTASITSSFALSFTIKLSSIELSQSGFRTLLAKYRARPYRADRVYILLRNTRS